MKIIDELAEKEMNFVPGVASESWIALRKGDESLRGLLMTPLECVSDVVHVFVHGGGWTHGSPQLSRDVVGRLAVHSKHPVLAVEYSLAPKNPYPIAIREVVLACRILADEGRLGSIFGGSAGAQIALAATTMLRDSKSLMPRAAILFNGAFAMNTNGETHRLYGDGSMQISTASMREYIALYGVALADDQRYGDMTLADLGGLPPLWISCGDRDPLLADSLTVYRRSVAAGNPSRLQILAGREHGYINRWYVDRQVDEALFAAVEWANGQLM